jgi:hypothetical protein
MIQNSEQFTTYFGLGSSLERGLCDHARAAEHDWHDCLRIRAALRADVIRTADLYWEEAQEDVVEGYRRMLDGDPRAAVVGLKRSAAGCRWLIARWEYLEQKLAADGTWYGCDRIEAIQLQGLSAMVEDLYISEQAYMTWLNCLAAQPNSTERDIQLVLDRRVMPKSIQDRDGEVWRPDPAMSRAALAAIVARELAMLRLRAPILRVRYEEPARAAARELALARLAHRQDEVALLRAQRGHEQTYQRACQTFLKMRRALASAGDTVAWDLRRRRVAAGARTVCDGWTGKSIHFTIAWVRVA